MRSAEAGGSGLVAPTIGAEPSRDELAGWIEAIAEHSCRDAFANLFRYYAPRIKGYLVRLGAGAHQAEELVQDVMLTLWRKAHLYDRSQASASTWIFTIARNRRIDVLRRERHLEIDPEDPVLVPEAEVSPHDALLAGQREDRLRAAIKHLPEEQLDLLQRAFFAGQTHREIADETGLPLGTVKSRLRLAFGRLRKALDGQV
ncbi:MAG: sigma-70 family RNA polymerase sigma factor [Pseudomonadota bacterium]